MEGLEPSSYVHGARALRYLSYISHPSGFLLRFMILPSRASGSAGATKGRPIPDMYVQGSYLPCHPDSGGKPS